MDVESQKILKKVVPWIGHNLKIQGHNLCFCGSGKNYNECCEIKTYEELFFLEGFFDQLEGMRKAKGGKIETIPEGVWKKIEEASITRSACLYPGCKKAAINSHLIPENILRSAFGLECSMYKKIDHAVDDYSFEKVPVTKACAFHVFCAGHDNDIFEKVDTLEIDFTNKEYEFRLAFKAIAFSLWRVQFLLGIDSQVALVRPILISERNPDLKNVIINFDHLKEQYERFVTTYEVYTGVVDALENENWDYFSYFHRSIPYTGKDIFFGNFVNPSHDLEGDRINTARANITMTCNVFTRDGCIYILLACPDGFSKNLYKNFFEQLEGASDERVINAINNLINLGVNHLLLYSDFQFTEQMKRKLAKVKEKAKKCIAGNGVFDLNDGTKPVNFIYQKSPNWGF